MCFLSVVIILIEEYKHSWNIIYFISLFLTTVLVRIIYSHVKLNSHKVFENIFLSANYLSLLLVSMFIFPWVWRYCLQFLHIFAWLLQVFLLWVAFASGFFTVHTALAFGYFLPVVVHTLIILTCVCIFQCHRWLQYLPCSLYIFPLNPFTAWAS